MVICVGDFNNDPHLDYHLLININNGKAWDFQVKKQGDQNSKATWLIVHLSYMNSCVAILCINNA